VGAGLEVLGAVGAQRRHVLDGADASGIVTENRITDDIVGFRRLWECHDDAAWTDDAGLLAGDLGEGVSEKFLMIERDVGNDANPRFDDIGGVEASAHADFEDGNVDLLAGEIFEGYRRQHLEKAGMPREVGFGNQPLGSPVDQVMSAGKVIVRDR
jgi:hypothetical protein